MKSDGSSATASVNIGANIGIGMGAGGNIGSGSEIQKPERSWCVTSRIPRIHAGIGGVGMNLGGHLM